MDVSPPDILVFSGDKDFRKSMNELLLDVGIESVVFTDKKQEAAVFLRDKTDAVMIFDSLYGTSDIRKLIYNEICIHRQDFHSEAGKPYYTKSYCVYVCERSDEDLYGGLYPNVFRLNRPYTIQSFYETVLHATYNLRNMIISEAAPSPSGQKDPILLPMAVTDTLHNIGIPAHLKGYTYLRRAISAVAVNPDMLNLITKNLYVNIGDEFGTTSVSVERAIRHGIDIAWERGNIALLNAHFGKTVTSRRGRPTNSEFIATVAERIRDNFQIKC